MHVRFIGTVQYSGSTKLPKKPKHFNGIISEYLGTYAARSTGESQDWWGLKGLPGDRYAGRALVPINPDNEAWGSFNEMINEFNKEKVV